MKNILLVGLILVSSWIFSGCSKTKSVINQLNNTAQTQDKSRDETQAQSKSNTNKDFIDNYEFHKESNGTVNITKESLHIQQDESLSKEQKGVLLIELQRINRQQLDDALNQAK